MGEQALPQSATSMKPDELAELFSAFNEVGARLEQTHVALQSEVARLNTELRRANAEIERSKRLAALGEMAAGIAHEVRNPLGSIRLYAGMLDEDLGAMPEQRSIARKIASAVNGLDDVVGDVLSFSREMKVQSEPVGAGELLERACDACRAELGAVRWVGGQPPVIKVACDAMLAQQALVNVLRNAAQADGASGGPVVLGAFERTNSDGSFIVLSITDAGPGIAPEVVERMFNPFFTTRATGTGLGLPIVARIMDVHGGRVVVANNAALTPGAIGATVELWFSSAAIESPVIEVKQSMPTPTGRKNPAAPSAA